MQTAAPAAAPVASAIAAQPAAQPPRVEQQPPAERSPWSNPAAAAALKTSADLLKAIETGITQNYGDVDRVRSFAVDLRSTNDILATATDALTADAFPENDQFVPLIERAGTGVSSAEVRLSSKEIGSTWPFERSDILAAVRQARLLSHHAAQSLEG